MQKASGTQGLQHKQHLHVNGKEQSKQLLPLTLEQIKYNLLKQLLKNVF